MGVAPERLLSAHQIHSPDVVVATGPWQGDKPRADALVTGKYGTEAWTADGRLPEGAQTAGSPAGAVS